MHPSVQGIKWRLCLFDLVVYVASLLVIFWIRGIKPNTARFWIQFGIFVVCLFVARLLFKVYQQIWRYGSMQAYARLFAADLSGGALYYIIQRLLPEEINVDFVDFLSVLCLNLVGCTFMRMVYLYIYRYGSKPGKLHDFLRRVMKIFTGIELHPATKEELDSESRKIKVAIVGAGRVGATLAEELISNPNAAYLPCVFFEENPSKIGREMIGIPVVDECRKEESIVRYGIQEIIIAIPNKSAEEKKALYDRYKSTGCKVKVYDYPTAYTAGAGKRTLREFDVDELLFRVP